MLPATADAAAAPRRSSLVSSSNPGIWFFLLCNRLLQVFNIFVVLDFRSNHFSSSCSVIEPCSATPLVSHSNPGIDFYHCAISYTLALRIFVALDFILNHSRTILVSCCDCRRIKPCFGFGELLESMDFGIAAIQVKNPGSHCGLEFCLHRPNLFYTMTFWFIFNANFRYLLIT